MYCSHYYIIIMTENYKEMDRKVIMDFIAAKGGEVDVDVIISESGAEKLRVFPILFEDEQNGHIEVVEHTMLGAAQRVRLL